jgi:hypothetical protein
MVWNTQGGVTFHTCERHRPDTPQSPCLASPTEAPRHNNTREARWAVATAARFLISTCWAIEGVLRWGCWADEGCWAGGHVGPVRVLDCWGCWIGKGRETLHHEATLPFGDICCWNGKYADGDLTTTQNNVSTNQFTGLPALSNIDAG